GSLSVPATWPRIWGIWGTTVIRTCVRRSRMPLAAFGRRGRPRGFSRHSRLMRATGSRWAVSSSRSAALWGSWRVRARRSRRSSRPAPMSPTGPAGDQAQAQARAHRTIAKISWRILPLIVLIYFVAYIDRTNVGFAAIGMNRDLGFSVSTYAWGAGIFFVGYLLFEVP